MIGVGQHLGPGWPQLQTREQAHAHNKVTISVDFDWDPESPGGHPTTLLIHLYHPEQGRETLEFDRTSEFSMVLDPKPRLWANWTIMVFLGFFYHCLVNY